MRERDRKKLAKAIETIRNPAPGVKLVSHGWVSRKETAIADVTRAVESLVESGVSPDEVAKVLGEAFSKVTGQDLGAVLKPTSWDRVEDPSV